MQATAQVAEHHKQMINHEEIEALRSICPELSLGEESGTEYILIGKLILPEGCTPECVDGLLCPTPRDGYSSRLFLSSEVAHHGQGKNWNAKGVLILGKRWWAVSWKTPEEQTLLQMFQNHLIAFRK